MRIPGGMYALAEDKHPVSPHLAAQVSRAAHSATLGTQSVKTLRYSAALATTNSLEDRAR